MLSSFSIQAFLFLHSYEDQNEVLRTGLLCPTHPTTEERKQTIISLGAGLPKKGHSLLPFQKPRSVSMFLSWEDGGSNGWTGKWRGLSLSAESTFTFAYLPFQLWNQVLVVAEEHMASPLFIWCPSSLLDHVTRRIKKIQGSASIPTSALAKCYVAWRIGS